METKMNADPWENPRFQLWSVSSEPPKNTPLVEYGKANDKRFTIRVVHGGFFTDYPGKSYQKTKVNFISFVNIDLLNMEMLGHFSKSLGYTTMGNWYHMPTEENCGLSLIPIMNDDCLGTFKMIVRAHQFREIEHLDEKLIHLFVTEHSMATVDDGIAYIRHMLNMTIPREKKEDVMDMAKENVIAWKNIV
ncbi:unnamed protein product [Lactuca virosa]|uniref:Uncharacterized protein n=1 Tax=Lactuca virosa TaxID=75947 RepID=A0AAU9MBJ6_9ASTR|nr:unnamed protein product [Lactuca virosa]